MVAVAVPRELFEHRRQVVKGDDARDQRRDVDGARDDQVACLLELGRVTEGAGDRVLLEEQIQQVN